MLEGRSVERLPVWETDKRVSIQQCTVLLHRYLSAVAQQAKLILTVSTSCMLISRNTSATCNSVEPTVHEK